MRLATLFSLVVVVGLSGQGAHAFQEQGGKQQGQGATSAAPTTPSSSSNMPRTGTEIRIPGLGPVGTLPKFDFGLELLYGAGDNRSPEPPTKSEPSEVQIRGTLKYKFNN